MSLSSRWKTGGYRVDQPILEEPKPDLTSVDDLPAEEYVDLAYQIILGRTADLQALQQHVELLTTGKKTRRQLVYELTKTSDFKAVKPDISDLDAEDFVSLTYQVILGRRGSSEEVAHNAERIRAGKISKNHLLYTMYQSQEFVINTWGGLDFWLVVHRARLIVAAQLPKAERIVDLGGSCEGSPQGALLMFGYPYTFKSLSIVELPREQRHETYTEICGEYSDVIQTPQGPVNYVYTSMTDLSAFEDATIDLVYAGQSIEHVTADEAVTVLSEVHRILKPGGHFCFDTPNRNVTKLEFPNYIVDDHKYEYTHAELIALIEGNGFAVREAKGLVLMDRSVHEGRFIDTEVLGRDRLYDDIESCFLLYYKAQKP